jgi:hypothetical protein
MMGEKLGGLVRKYGDDLLVLAGCGCILYGTWLLSIIAVWFVGGGMLIGLGLLVGMKDEG